MGTITQTAPLSDSVTVPESDTYLNQLMAAGSSGSVTWVTTEQSGSFIVSPAGLVGNTTILAVGTYTASGTMSDTGGNTGIWSFTLTVTASVSPQTAVVPVNPQAPTGLEILVPFQIDPTIGGVQTLQDYSAIIAQHIATALMTSAFERVMLPAYGVGLRNSVFKNFANGVPSPLQSDITKGLAALVPEASINSVKVQPDPTNANVLVVTVEFSVVPYSGTNTVTVAVGGPISQVSAS